MAVPSTLQELLARWDKEGRPLLLNGKSARDKTAYATPKKNRLHVDTSKVNGRHASRVYMRIVANKNIPVTKVPRNPPKTAQLAKGIVFDRGITRRWSFLNFDMPKSAKNETAGYTIMLWAAYYPRDSTQFFRYSFYVQCSNKSEQK